MPTDVGKFASGRSIGRPDYGGLVGDLVNAAANYAPSAAGGHATAVHQTRRHFLGPDKPYLDWINARETGRKPAPGRTKSINRSLYMS